MAVSRRLSRFCRRIYSRISPFSLVWAFWWTQEQGCFRIYLVLPETPPISGTNHPTVAKSHSHGKWFAVTAPLSDLLGKIRRSWNNLSQRNARPLLLAISCSIFYTPSLSSGKVINSFALGWWDLIYTSCINYRIVWKHHIYIYLTEILLLQLLAWSQKKLTVSATLHAEFCSLVCPEGDKDINKCDTARDEIDTRWFIKGFDRIRNSMFHSRANRSTTTPCYVHSGHSLSLRGERQRPAERSKPSRSLTSLGWRRSLLFSVAVVASFDEQLFPSRCGQVAQKLGFPFSWCRKRESSPSTGSVHRDMDKIRSTALPIWSIYLSLRVIFLTPFFSPPPPYVIRQFGEVRARAHVQSTEASVTLF